MLSRVASLLQVRSGEARLAALLAGLFACIQAGQGIGANTADALFFLRFGVEYLPYMFMALGATTLVSSLAYAAGLGRLHKGRFMRALLGAIAAILVVERAAILLDLPILYPVLWLTVNVSSAILGIFVWNVAGQVCDARQAKRLFSLFASAGILGGVIGNTLTGPLARLLGTENLLGLYSGLLLVALLLMRAIVGEFFRPDGAASQASLWEDIRAGFEITRRSRLMQLIVYASILFSVLFFSMSFPFSKVVTASFPSEARVAGFLGLFSSTVTAITFFTSLFVANRLYARIGVANAVLLLPIAYLGGFVLWAVDFNLTTAVVARLGQMVLLGGIAAPAWNTFFNVIPPEKRGQVQAFESGVPSQLGVAISGALIILGERILNTTLIFGMGMLTALLTGLLVWRMRIEYGASLVQALREGLIDVFTAAPGRLASLGADANARETALAGLADAKPEVRRASAEILGQLRLPQAVEPLAAALDDPDRQVRCAALSALAQLDARSAAGSVAGLLRDPDPAVRAKAIDAYARLASDPLESLAGMIEDPDPEVRARAAVALCRAGEEADAASAVAALLRSSRLEDRLAGLGAVAECPKCVEFNVIAGFLKEETPSLRLAAIHALAALDHGSTTASLVQSLADPDERVRHAAATALRDSSHASQPILEVLQRGPDVAQEAALVALEGRGQAARTAVVNWALAQVPVAARHRAWNAALYRLADERVRGIAFLRDLLHKREQQTQRRILSALALVGTPEALRLVARGLHARDKETRAQALEALDTLGDKRVARALIPLLEDERAGSPADARSVLEEMTTCPDPWLRAFAIHAIGELLSRDYATLIQRARQDSAAIVREAAAGAVAVTGGGKMPETSQTLGTIDRILFLRQVPIFGDLTPEDLQRIAEIARERVFFPGDYLCREGEVGDELFVIVEGKVRVAKQSNGDLRTLRTLQTGEQIGELAILREQPRSASVIAEEGTVRALVLRGDALQAILRDRPEVAMGMLASLAQRLSTIS